MNTTKDDAIEAFVARLVLERKYPSMDSRVREELTRDLTLRVEKYVTMSIVAKLPSERLPEFQKLMEEGDNDETVAAFCKEHVPHLDEVTATALLRFRDTYLG